MIRIDVKPLSVNETWKGKRYKTNAYLSYEKLLMYLLPKIEIPKAPYLIKFEFGFSSKGSDWDNPIKPLQDVLQKKYGFNDKDVYEAVVSKKIVKKGEEYLKFKIESI
jgi:Holliday junction resolvase RusA-like endonuclease